MAKDLWNWEARQPKNGGGFAIFRMTAQGARRLDNLDGLYKRETALKMAAADDLLEAAKKALDECVDLIGTPAGNALEAAIAKATGGAA